ncbi:MAG: hypothetical protein AB9919_06995 [Geobacteraceae bacterium]|jgi:hypothetical protein
MLLDVRTLFVADAVTTVFIGLALLFYGKKRKTYPGFNHWMLGSLIVSASYVATFLRGTIPELLSIMLVNGGFVLSGVVRLDGVLRFLRGKKLHWLLYCLPVVAMATAAYFTLAHDDMAIRLIFLTFWGCLLLWSTATIFVFSAPAASRSLHLIAAVITFLYGVSMLSRTVFFVLDPPALLFENTHFNSIFFLSVLIFEIWSGLLIMMLNNQRMEEELLVSHAALQSHVVELEKVLSEVKVLKGLLPICSSCKKIRDDQGCWNHLEDYIDTHSEATFTHGLCPGCALQMQKEIAEMKFPEKNLTT